MPLTRNSRIALLAIIGLNLLLRLVWLGANELAHDEPFTVYWSQRPLSEFWSMLRSENNPPLHFLITRWWSALVPFEPAWLRVPSAIAGALVVWPVFALAHRLSGLRAALVAAALITFSNYHQGFAHEARAYSLFTLFAATGMWLLWRASDRPTHRMRAILGLSVLNTVMVYTHLFGWLAIGMQGLCVLLIPELRQLRRTFFLGATITVLSFTPYLPVFTQRLMASTAEGTWLQAPAPEEVYNMLWRWSNAPVMAVALLALVLLALLRDRGRSIAIRLGLLWGMGALLAMFAVSLVVPVFLDRYLVFAAPGWAILIAGAVGVWPPRFGWGMTALVVLGLAVTYTPWKEGPYHPSRTVAQVDAWCAEPCRVQVVPTWYWLNFMAARSFSDLREDQRGKLAGTQSVPVGFVPEPGVEAIVVDATGGIETAASGWRARIGKHYMQVDSIETDHKVWVYRFRHTR